MGRFVLIGVLVLSLLFLTLILSMNKQAVNLPQVFTNELSSKETQNLSNYALRYGLQYAQTQNFPATSGYTYLQSFNNFFYKYGFIDSIRYSYVSDTGDYQVKAYTRTTLNGQHAVHEAVAGISGLSTTYGKGDIAHWSFDSDLLDFTANNNDGVNCGGIRFLPAGKSNFCITLDGINDYMYALDANSLDLPNKFSISVWANWNSKPNGWTPLVWKPRPVGKCYENNDPAYGIWIYKDKLYGQVTKSDGTYLKVVSPNTVEALGTWHLINMTYGNGSMKLYYDGSLVGTASGTTAAPINTSMNLMIGRMDAPMCGGYVFGQGKLEEIGFYSYVFTPAQILAIRNSANGLLPTTTGTPQITYMRE